MVHSLKTKLTVYFSVLLLFSLGSITILFNLTMDSLFAHYANDQRQSQIQQIIQQIEEQEGLRVVGAMYHIEDGSVEFL